MIESVYLISHVVTIAFVFGFLETLKVNYKPISSVCMYRMIVWIALKNDKWQHVCGSAWGQQYICAGEE